MTDYESLQALLGSFKREQAELREHIVSILWHMRGGLSREEAWTLSPQERSDVLKFIAERWKMVEKTKLPLV